MNRLTPISMNFSDFRTLVKDHPRIIVAITIIGILVLVGIKKILNANFFDVKVTNLLEIQSRELNIVNVKKWVIERSIEDTLLAIESHLSSSSTGVSQPKGSQKINAFLNPKKARNLENESLNETVSTPEITLQILGKLSPEKIFEIADHIIPSRNPTEKITTKKEQFSSKVYQVAAKVNQILSTFSGGLFDFNLFFERIEHYPTKFMSLVYGWMASFAFQRTIQSLTPLINKYIGKTDDLERKFGNVITTAAISCTVALYIIQRQFHSHLIESISDRLKQRQIPYRNFDLMPKFRKFCQDIKNSLNRSRTEPQSSIWISYKEGKDGSVRECIESLQEMAERGKFNLSQCSFGTKDVHKLEINELDINFFLSKCISIEEVKREWNHVISEHQDNPSSILWFTNIENFLFSILEDEKHQANEIETPLQHLALQFKTSIAQGNLRCIISSSNSPYLVMMKNNLPSNVKKKFQELNAPILSLDELKTFFKSMYQPQDREGEFPVLPDQTLEALMNEIERSNLLGISPSHITPGIEALISDIQFQAQNSLPIDQRGITDIEKKLTRARQIFERTFEEWGQCKQSGKNGYSPQCQVIAKRLIILTKIMIPLLRRRISEERKPLEITSEHLYKYWKKTYKNLPAFTTEKEQQRICRSREIFTRKVIGRKEIIDEICESWFTWRQNPRKDDFRPAFAYFFAGPPGVGKTEFVKVIAEIHNETFKVYEKTTKSKTIYLAGLQPKEVSDKFAEIYDFILEDPSGILIFEEIEKIEATSLQKFIELLGPGPISYTRYYKNQRRGIEYNIDRRNNIVILTSNLWPADKQNYEYQQVKEFLEPLMSKSFGDAFTTRITHIFPFIPLTDEEMTLFIKRFLEEQGKDLRKNFSGIFFDDSICDYYLKKTDGNLRTLVDTIRSDLTKVLRPHKGKEERPKIKIFYDEKLTVEIIEIIDQRPF